MTLLLSLGAAGAAAGPGGRAAMFVGRRLPGEIDRPGAEASIQAIKQ